MDILIDFKDNDYYFTFEGILRMLSSNNINNDIAYFDKPKLVRIINSLIIPSYLLNQNPNADYDETKLTDLYERLKIQEKDVKIESELEFFLFGYEISSSNWQMVGNIGGYINPY